MSSFTPTLEQEQIVDLFRTGGSVRVRAGAGTGKTSTLQLLGDVLGTQNRIGLYIAFNSSIAKEAGRKFPKHVDARTAHSLAYNTIRQHHAYGDLIDKLRGNRIPFHLTRQQFNIAGGTVTGADDQPRTLSAFAIGRHASATIEEFCKTTDDTLGPQHVPAMPGLDFPGRKTNHQGLVDIVLPYAKAMWRDLLDPRGTSVTFTHSVYLKLWQLERPLFGPDGAALFVDEAQDISPVLADVIDRQTHLQRVIVGDSAQAIYRFTGAIDYMSTAPVDHTGILSQSWRFGQDIADAANIMLGRLRDDMRLIGNPNRHSVIDRNLAQPDAILTRTNGAALAHVIAHGQGRKVHLMADTQYAMRFCEAAEQLMNGERCTMADLAAFDTWDQVVEYAEDASDAADWKVLIKLIEDHTIEGLQDALANVVEERKADLIVCTAHKSKGREFDRVVIDDSVHQAVERARNSDRPDAAAVLRDEQMLAYVAITRAKLALNPGALLDPPKPRENLHRTSDRFVGGAIRDMNRNLAHSY